MSGSDPKRSVSRIRKLPEGVVDTPELYKGSPQRMYVLDEEKLRRCVSEYFDLIAKSKDWWTPAALFLTALLTIATADFKDVVLTKDLWRYFFVLVLGASGLWLFVSVKNRVVAPKPADFFESLGITIGASAADDASFDLPGAAAATGQSATSELNVAEAPQLSLVDLITSETWRLIFPSGGSKLVTFDKNGNVVEGRNSSEHSWQVDDANRLWFIREDGGIQSAFDFNEINKVFVCANLPEAKRTSDGQRLVRLNSVHVLDV